MEIRRSHIFFAISLIALAAALIRPDLIGRSFALIVMGVIPGTPLTIPSWVMLSVFTLALLWGIGRLKDTPVYRPYTSSHDRARRNRARRIVLRKTSVKTSARRGTAHEQVASNAAKI